MIPHFGSSVLLKTGNEKKNLCKFQRENITGERQNKSLSALNIHNYDIFCRDFVAKNDLRTFRFLQVVRIGNLKTF